MSGGDMGRQNARLRPIAPIVRTERGTPSFPDEAVGGRSGWPAHRKNRALFRRAYGGIGKRRSDIRTIRAVRAPYFTSGAAFGERLASPFRSAPLRKIGLFRFGRDVFGVAITPHRAAHTDNGSENPNFPYVRVYFRTPLAALRTGLPSVGRWGPPDPRRLLGASALTLAPRAGQYSRIRIPFFPRECRFL